MAETQVCAASDVPENGAISREVGEELVAIYNINGTYYATEARCTHGMADLADGTLDALVTLTELPAAPGTAHPAVPVALKGPLFAPNRTVDTSLLTSWLTLQAVERQSRQIDAMERAGRELRPPEISPDATGGLPADARAPSLPPPINIPAVPKPRAPPRAENTAPRAGSTAPPPAMAGPPDLVGAQH